MPRWAETEQEGSYPVSVEKDLSTQSSSVLFLNFESNLNFDFAWLYFHDCNKRQKTVAEKPRKQKALPFSSFFSFRTLTNCLSSSGVMEESKWA